MTYRTCRRPCFEGWSFVLFLSHALWSFRVEWSRKVRSQYRHCRLQIVNSKDYTPLCTRNILIDWQGLIWGGETKGAFPPKVLHPPSPWNISINNYILIPNESIIPPNLVIQCYCHPLKSFSKWTHDHDQYACGIKSRYRYVTMMYKCSR